MAQHHGRNQNIFKEMKAAPRWMRWMRGTGLGACFVGVAGSILMMDTELGSLFGWLAAFGFGAAFVASIILGIWLELRKKNKRVAGFNVEAEVNEQLSVLTRAGTHQMLSDVYIFTDKRSKHASRVDTVTQRAQIDHLLVSSKGVFHIETKASGQAVEFKPDGYYVKGQQQSDPRAQLQRHQQVIERALGNKGVQADVVGIIYYPNNPLVTGDTWGLPVITHRQQLIPFLQSYEPQKRLTAEEMRQVFEALQSLSKQAPQSGGAGNRRGA